MIAAYHFLRPWWLLLIPAAAVLLWLWHRRADPRTQWGALIAPHLLDALLVGAHGAPRWQPIHGVALGLVLIGLAVAGPTWDKEPPPFGDDRAPMMIAIDLSPSMDATDVAPTRLERVKQKVHDLAALRPGSRTGLVVYAGTAHLVLPPAEDPALLALFLDALTTDLMPVAGRHAAAALAVADDLLVKEAAPGTILFFSDGVDGADLPAFAQRRAATQSQVLALGVGTLAGGPLRTKDGGVATDAGGRPLQARFDAVGFHKLATEAGVPVASVSVDDTDVRWVQRRAERHLQLVEQGNVELRWRERGYWLTFPIAGLTAFWFRRGWVVRWLAGVLVAATLGATVPSNAAAAPALGAAAPSLGAAAPAIAATTPAIAAAAPAAGATAPPRAAAPAIDAATPPRATAPTIDAETPPTAAAAPAPARLLLALFLTPDQRGRWNFEHGDYAAAAEHFTDPLWKGLAFYRAANYSAALGELARLTTPEAFFLMGNCHAHMKDYPRALADYDNALAGRPQFPQATANRALVATLIRPPSDDDQAPDPNLPPDQVKFDQQGKHGKAGPLEVPISQLSAELWMRNLTMSPADFLRAKFRIQAEAAAAGQAAKP